MTVHARTAPCVVCGTIWKRHKDSPLTTCSLPCRLAAYSTPGENGCVLWTGNTMPNGYGRVQFGERRSSVHRAAYELAHGKVPRGLCVLHRCDTPLCINPDHLWLGTQADNMKDMILKGRSATRKLTARDIAKIRSLGRRGRAPVHIAPRFGVSPSTVVNVLARRTWKEA